MSSYNASGKMDIAALSRTIDAGEIKALVVDVDGTLYRHSYVRRRMLARLLFHGVKRPDKISGVLRALRAYRHAQESMRQDALECDSLADEQIRVASRACGLPPEIVQRHVAEWMQTSPLDLLLPAKRSDVAECIRKAKQRGLKLGVWSDYPATAKLTAMQFDGVFDVVVTAQDKEVQRFKPDPRGLEIALKRLGTSKEQAVYVGDRADVDGVAAERAGVRVVIVGSAK